MAHKSNPAFVLIHGAWHDETTWQEISPRLNSSGYATLAITLPGAGKKALSPDSYNNRPLNSKAFATEPSPNAATSQKSRDAAAFEAIEQAKQLGNGNVILVGHSLGGLTLSSVAEQHPDLITALIYVSAFLLPNGTPAVKMILSEIMSAAIVPSLFRADPEAVGALRIDPQSTDLKYLSRLKSAFYGDLSDSKFSEVRQNLHCDEPAQVTAIPSQITAQNMGRVSRFYVFCREDNAIPFGAQQYMVSTTDTELGNLATTYELDCSHSPFYAQADKLTEILVSAAKSNL